MRCEFGQGVREWAQDFWNEILFPFFCHSRTFVATDSGCGRFPRSGMNSAEG